jgi:hypothetical protein
LNFKRSSYIRQLRNSIARRGFWQAIKLVPDDLKYMAYRLVRHFRRPDPEEASFDREEREFDRAMRMMTSAVVRLVGVTVKSDNVLLGSTYVATPVSLLRLVLDGLSIHHPDFTFIDFGSGMGRVVLYAARSPYRQVIGIEFAEELHAAAEQNVRHTDGDPERLSPIRLYCMDAVDFEPPDGNLVCFFFNPFAAPVMEKVVGGLTRSLADGQRDCMLVYLHPIERAAIDTDPHWEVQEEGQSYVIYRFKDGQRN